MKETCYFDGDTADYGPKSICGTEWNPFEIVQGREKRSWSINRNHQSSGFVPIKLTRDGCLKFRHQGNAYTTLLPEMLSVQFCAGIRDYEW
jgi:hypothetical protein